MLRAMPPPANAGAETIQAQAFKLLSEVLQPFLTEWRPRHRRFVAAERAEAKWRRAEECRAALIATRNALPADNQDDRPRDRRAGIARGRYRPDIDRGCNAASAAAARNSQYGNRRFVEAVAATWTARVIARYRTNHPDVLTK